MSLPEPLHVSFSPLTLSKSPSVKDCQPGPVGSMNALIVPDSCATATVTNTRLTKASIRKSGVFMDRLSRWVRRSRFDCTRVAHARMGRLRAFSAPVSNARESDEDRDLQRQRDQ